MTEVLHYTESAAEETEVRCVTDQCVHNVSSDQNPLLWTRLYVTSSEKHETVYRMKMFQSWEGQKHETVGAGGRVNSSLKERNEW